ncbi:MAG: ribonuclease HII [Candidatus Brennerbacteria bacterium CG11_big_fil_rev_8_21_14_0_20_43_10]|uniref:Ribonuclease n=2 Tax=Candidatus Brenneribacteriota TaxID=1817902 RepID=A0A2H0PXU5_9BACT|nr:MAG: ribonuclease HII [Parcubacteria group bacterium CG1_02_44_31]PIP50173.1 MAG: ribonuclease HII [Candidatus Brennerbacteria bacterium CG23_combo_of_CG06-09_8_20_14_all_44_41]PIR26892.1 MAG: ribonuclease HII [Candidatus Brennerbacteria bacterium CG11_big_fil_rev_8_21_14_0_20_43_10]PJA19195.1 MAG: ribonuclease HII [Candidatus Brennerbacteria bacterium CG_4_10_14_0_2_um_filter_43_14]
MLPDCKHEKRFWQRRKTLVFALDEAGRGSLAGPVVACAFCATNGFTQMPQPPIPVKDSKQLSQRRREALHAWMKTIPYFAYATAFVGPKTIDAINIRQANFVAMQRAIKKLRTHVPRTRVHALVDGNDPIPDIPVAQTTIIKGDAKVFSIACASIIAKVSRDTYMLRIAKKYPAYAFDKHKGYGTLKHRRLIRKHGMCAIHRKTFCKSLRINNRLILHKTKS